MPCGYLDWICLGKSPVPPHPQVNRTSDFPLTLNWLPYKPLGPDVLGESSSQRFTPTTRGGRG